MNKTITTIGIDLAKHSFRNSCVNDSGQASAFGFINWRSQFMTVFLSSACVGGLIGIVM